MNTDVTMPASASRAMAVFSLPSCAATSSPPSVVISSRPSGTSIAISGRSVHARPIISSVAAISRLSLMCTRSRKRRTSSSWTWRRSSRRCTVIPSAPPRCASTAAHTGSGSYVRRAWRSVATWSMLTPSSITPASRRSWKFSVVFERREVPHDAATEDAPLLEIVIENPAHQTLRLGRDIGIGVALGRERDQRRAPHDRPADLRLGGDAARAAIEGVMVTFARRDRGAGVDIVRKCKAVAELRKEAHLETAQHGSLRGWFRVRRQLAKSRRVLREQSRMRVFARQQLQQQFVQVETAQQRRAARQREAAAPIGLDQRLELPRAGPRQCERLECLQHAAKLRARSLRALRDHRDAPEPLGERLDDEARLLVRIRVQDERRLVVVPVAKLSHESIEWTGRYRARIAAWQPATRTRLNSRAFSASRRCPPSRA